MLNQLLTQWVFERILRLGISCKLKGSVVIQGPWWTIFWVDFEYFVSSFNHILRSGIIVQGKMASNL